METLLFALNAILPIILLILLGYFLKRMSFLDEAWLKKGNTLVFKVFLPCLLFINVYNIDSFATIDWSVVIFSEIAILVLFLLGMLLVKFTVSDSRQKGAVLQCVFRSNFAIIGLPIAQALGNADGVGIAAILGAFSIPTFNVLGVVALTMYLEDGEKKAKIKQTLKKVVTNPLILGVFFGFVALVIRSLIPNVSADTPAFSIERDLPFLYAAVNNIGKIASPLALIIWGGLFDFSSIQSRKGLIVIGTVTRVLFVPFLTLGSALLLFKFTDLLQFGKEAFPGLLALFGSPVAVSSAIMAQEMDNDGILAGQFVVWTSVCSIFTLFVFIVALRSIGML